MLLMANIYKILGKCICFVFITVSLVLLYQFFFFFLPHKKEASISLWTDFELGHQVG